MIWRCADVMCLQRNTTDHTETAELKEVLGIQE